MNFIKSMSFYNSLPHPLLFPTNAIAKIKLPSLIPSFSFLASLQIADAKIISSLIHCCHYTKL